jgi:sarcosine oxidase subunit gamma
MVRLRVRPQDADAAGEELQLPLEALQWRNGDPSVCWLGPDQWLFTSDTRPAEEIIGHIDNRLVGQLFAATDMSSQNACFALRGPAARTVLAMGCGIDMHASTFKTGQCMQTNFANVLLLIVAVEDDNFDLYVDRSHARYLGNWLTDSSEDPVTRDSARHAQ